MSAPIKLFPMFHLPEEELRFNKRLSEGHMVCLYIFAWLIMIINQDGSFTKQFTDKDCIQSVYITGLDICQNITSSLPIP